MMRAALAAGHSSNADALVTPDNIAPQPDRRKVPEDDSGAVPRLPRLSCSEQAELRAKHDAIALAGHALAELGRLMLAAEAECKADPTATNYQQMIEATKRYQTAHDTDRCVDEYVATERKVIASARAREAREVGRAPARVTHRAPRQHRRPRQRRSHRVVRVAKPSSGDSGDGDPEPPTPRARGPPARGGVAMS